MKKANVSRVLNRFVLPAGILATASATSALHADWPQWGGPNRDFLVAKANLAEKWPEDGPRRLWRHGLGEGYSSIIAQDGVLYTMYRSGKTPHVFTIAVDAKSGNTIWETKHDSPIPTDMKAHPGPHSTPLLSGDRLFSVGRIAVFAGTGATLLNAEPPRLARTMVACPLRPGQRCDRRRGGQPSATFQRTGAVRSLPSPRGCCRPGRSGCP